MGFLGDLTNWYVRLNRDRMKGDDAGTSLAVMFEVLLSMTSLMSPFTPFFAEYLYQRLRKRLPEFQKKEQLPKDVIGAAESIHYVMLPQPTNGHAAEKNGSVERCRAVRGMMLLQRVVELGRRARDEAKINMKTPVRSVTVVTKNAEDVAALEFVKAYVFSELNAWDLSMTTDVDKWCVLSALPKHPELPKKLGKQYKAANDLIKQLTSPQLRQLLSGATPTIPLPLDPPVELTQDDLLITISFCAEGKDATYSAQTTPDGTLTVAVDTTQDDALKMQGITRELINRTSFSCSLNSSAKDDPSYFRILDFRIATCRSSDFIFSSD